MRIQCLLLQRNKRVDERITGQVEPGRSSQRRRVPLLLQHRHAYQARDRVVESHQLRASIPQAVPLDHVVRAAEDKRDLAQLVRSSVKQGAGTAAAAAAAATIAALSLSGCA